jgi:pSer/pThr/pTyr-binding forkhead associated (FHA) protein
MEARPLLLVPVRHDGLPGAVVAVGAVPVRCGRTEGQLRFGLDATVSPEHVRFTPSEGGVLVEDLGSVNGTFLRLRAPRPVRPGDELRLGRQRLRLDPLPAAAAQGAARPWGTADPAQRACLAQLLDGGGTGEVFPLRAGENLMGREVGAIRFPGDRYVSARHARLDVGEDGTVLTDLGSSNGTFVRLTAPAQLGAGDQLLVGMQLVRIEVS